MRCFLVSYEDYLIYFTIRIVRYFTLCCSRDSSKVPVHEWCCCVYAKHDTDVSSVLVNLYYLTPPSLFPCHFDGTASETRTKQRGCCATVEGLWLSLRPRLLEFGVRSLVPGSLVRLSQLSTVIGESPRAMNTHVPYIIRFPVNADSGQHGDLCVYLM